MIHSENKKERICVRRIQRRERRRRVAAKLMQDFAENTTLHGLRYITEKRLSLTEKLFWIGAVLISLSLCAMLIWNVWVKWQSSPVIVTFSERLVSVGEVPFPSVTICPQLKMKNSKYNTSLFEEVVALANKANWTQEEINKLQKHEDLNYTCYHFTTYHRNYSGAKIMENILEVSPTLEDVFFYCQWRGTILPCSQLFQPVVTSEGVCFTMNSLAATEILRVENLQKSYSYMNTSTPSKGWSLSGGYSTFDKDVYPRRGGSTNVYGDIGIILSEDPLEWNQYCRSYDQGHKVYLHHPADMPQSSLYYFSATPKQVVSFAVTASIMNTSVTLRSYPPETRQCFYPEERYLSYFLAYTPNNCRLECLSNYTFHRCGCVMFHMPHYDDSTICRANRYTCIKKASISFAEEEGRPDTEVGRCQCYPLCNSINYDAEILKTRFNFTRYLKSTNTSHPQLNKSNNYMHLEFYQKEPLIMAMRRSELFGLTDFLANCGGLLGLFLGFSFLSLVEIVYFLTLRLGCTLRQENQRADSATVMTENHY